MFQALTVAEIIIVFIPIGAFLISTVFLIRFRKFQAFLFVIWAIGLLTAVFAIILALQ
jgi:hypothetical protein